MSPERVRALRANRPHQLLGAPLANQIDGPSIAKQRIDAEEPGERGVLVVEAEDVRPDELEEIDFLGVERVDPGAAEPACHLRSADTEQIRQPRRRSEIDAQGLNFLGDGNGHGPNLAQHNLLRNIFCCTNHDGPGCVPARRAAWPIGSSPVADRRAQLSALIYASLTRLRKL